MSVDSTLFWSGDFSTVDISERRAPLVIEREIRGMLTWQGLPRRLFV